MALRKPAQQPAPQANQTAAPGQFEEDSGSAKVADKPATAVNDAAAATAGVAATTAIAKAATGAVALGGKMDTLFAAQQDAIPAVDFGVLPRLVGSNGNVLEKGDNKLLGSWVKLQLISWNKQFVISPGSDADEAKEHVRYSRDGETIDETGETVKGYLEKLRVTDGYADANVKEYAELIGILQSADKQTELVGSMVQVSLSPQSRKMFEGYRLQESVKLRLGARKPEGADMLKISAEVKTSGSNTYTLLKVSDGSK
jgi:Ca2+-binding RTX toxin-like protein